MGSASDPGETPTRAGTGDSTCWILIRGAAAGDEADREAFIRIYAPIVRSYLGARWGRGPLHASIDDAAQEVYLECFRPAGALDRAEPRRQGGFRAYLYGVVRNVARRFEERRARHNEARISDLDQAPAEEASLAEAFDRSWATALLQRAAALQREEAARAGPEALRRVELLQLRFGQDMPIREIARAWGEDPARLHHQYAQARIEYRRALGAVVRSLHGGGRPEVEAECRRIFAVFL